MSRSVATHSERGRPNGTTEIKRKDLRVRVTPELQRHQRQQHRFARPRRSHHKGMADVADVQRESEWRRSLGLAKQERRTPKVQIPPLAPPHARHPNPMRTLSLPTR